MADSEITKFTKSSLAEVIAKQGLVPVAVPSANGQPAKNYGVEAGDFYKHWTPEVTSAGDLKWTLVSGETVPQEQNIKGPPGDKGADGKDGSNGADGTDGKDGTDGVDGVSPAVATTEIPATSTTPKGYRISITDATHPATSPLTFDLFDGKDGQGGGGHYVLLDATASGATDESVLPTTGDSTALYFVKEDVSLAGESVDRYNLYIWDPEKVPTGTVFPDNSKYILVDEASYSAKEIIEMFGDVGAEIAAIVESRILYTVELGSVTTERSFSFNANEGGVVWTLFNPNMDMEVVAGDTPTSVAFATTDNITATDTSRYLCIGIYEYDLQSNTFKYMADTGNVVPSIQAKGESNKGLQVAHIKHVKYNPDKEAYEQRLRSAKLYAVVVASNINSIKFAGNTFQNVIHTVPSLGLCNYNYAVDPEAMDSSLPVFSGTEGVTPNGSLSEFHVFTAITNAEFSIPTPGPTPGPEPEPTVSPFVVVPSTGTENYVEVVYGDTAFPDTTAEGQTVTLEEYRGLLLQKIVPLADVELVSWTIIDSTANAVSTHPGSKVYDEDFQEIAGYGSGTCDVELAYEGALQGPSYEHRYAVKQTEGAETKTLKLEAGKTYWFGITSDPVTPKYWYITVTDDGATTYAPSTEGCAIANFYNVTYGTHNIQSIRRAAMNFKDKAGNTYRI